MAIKTGVFSHILSSMFANKSTLTAWISFFAVFTETWRLTQAGTCWQNVGNNRRCQTLITMRISKEDCCKDRRSALMGWTPQDEYTFDRIFYYQYIFDGAPECYPCHPTCDDVVCPGKERKCRIKDGLARCVCMPDCSRHDDRHRGQLCGTDGNTYKNYCTLLKSNCRNQRHTKVDYFGRCQYSCSRVHCPNGRHCVEDQNGMPHCISCDEHVECEAVPSETMCGADGRTYLSFCAFRKATCLNGRSIGLAYMGECDSSATCSTLNCEHGKKCLVSPVNNRPQCISCDPSCGSMQPANPICGTNGRTYDSWCDLHREACRSGIVLDTQHYGPCHQDGVFSDYPAQSDDYYRYAYDDER